MRPIDAHKLSDCLQMTRPCDDGIYGNVISAAIHVFYDLIREQPTIEVSPRWIRLEEKPPKENGRYLVWEASEFGFAYVDEWKDGAWVIGGSVPYTRVTHWTHIKPPKEGA